MSAAYRVSAGTQVHIDGVTFAEGDPLPDDVRSADLAAWLSSGWIEPAPSKSTKATRSR